MTTTFSGFIVVRSACSRPIDRDRQQLPRPQAVLPGDRRRSTGPERPEQVSEDAKAHDTGAAGLLHQEISMNLPARGTAFVGPPPRECARLRDRQHFLGSGPRRPWRRRILPLVAHYAKGVSSDVECSARPHAALAWRKASSFPASAAASALPPICGTRKASCLAESFLCSEAPSFLTKHALRAQAESFTWHNRTAEEPQVVGRP